MSPYNVLFVCTGNSARSIMAEALLNYRGRGRFRAYSAGSQPRGVVEPLALDALAGANIPAPDARSKSWDDFARPDSPRLDFVFTLCDEAAGEPCPVWPGYPVTAHWSTPDPAGIADPEVKRHAFAQILHDIDARVKILTSLRLEALDTLTIHNEVSRIALSSGATASAAR